MASGKIAPASDALQFIPLNRLKKSPRNVRTTPNTKAEIEALAASIGVHGLLQNPIIEPELDAKKKPTGDFLVTVGEGRRQALLLRAWSQCPAVVTPQEQPFFFGNLFCRKIGPGDVIGRLEQVGKRLVLRARCILQTPYSIALAQESVGVRSDENLRRARKPFEAELLSMRIRVE